MTPHPRGQHGTRFGFCASLTLDYDCAVSLQPDRDGGRPGVKVIPNLPFPRALVADMRIHHLLHDWPWKQSRSGKEPRLKPWRTSFSIVPSELDEQWLV